MKATDDEISSNTNTTTPSKEEHSRKNNNHLPALLDACTPPAPFSISPASCSSTTSSITAVDPIYLLYHQNRHGDQDDAPTATKTNDGYPLPGHLQRQRQRDEKENNSIGFWSTHLSPTGMVEDAYRHGSFVTPLKQKLSSSNTPPVVAGAALADSTHTLETSNNPYNENVVQQEQQYVGNGEGMDNESSVNDQATFYLETPRRISLIEVMDTPKEDQMTRPKHASFSFSDTPRINGDMVGVSLPRHPGERVHHSSMVVAHSESAAPLSQSRLEHESNAPSPGNQENVAALSHLDSDARYLPKDDIPLSDHVHQATPSSGKSLHVSQDEPMARSPIEQQPVEWVSSASRAAASKESDDWGNEEIKEHVPSNPSPRKSLYVSQDDRMATFPKQQQPIEWESTTSMVAAVKDIEDWGNDTDIDVKEATPSSGKSLMPSFGRNQDPVARSPTQDKLMDRVSSSASRAAATQDIDPGNDADEDMKGHIQATQRPGMSLEFSFGNQDETKEGLLEQQLPVDWLSTASKAAAAKEIEDGGNDAQEDIKEDHVQANPSSAKNSSLDEPMVSLLNRQQPMQGWVSTAAKDVDDRGNDAEEEMKGHIQATPSACMMTELSRDEPTVNALKQAQLMQGWVSTTSRAAATQDIDDWENDAEEIQENVQANSSPYKSLGLSLGSQDEQEDVFHWQQSTALVSPYSNAALTPQQEEEERDDKTASLLPLPGRPSPTSDKSPSKGVPLTNERASTNQSLSLDDQNSLEGELDLPNYKSPRLAGEPSWTNDVPLTDNLKPTFPTSPASNGVLVHVEESSNEKIQDHESTDDLSLLEEKGKIELINRECTEQSVPSLPLHECNMDEDTSCSGYETPSRHATIVCVPPTDERQAAYQRVQGKYMLFCRGGGPKMLEKGHDSTQELTSPRKSRFETIALPPPTDERHLVRSISQVATQPPPMGTNTKDKPSSRNDSLRLENGCIPAAAKSSPVAALQDVAQAVDRPAAFQARKGHYLKPAPDHDVLSPAMKEAEHQESTKEPRVEVSSPGMSRLERIGCVPPTDEKQVAKGLHSIPVAPIQRSELKKSVGVETNTQDETRRVTKQCVQEESMSSYPIVAQELVLPTDERWTQDDPPTNVTHTSSQDAQSQEEAQTISPTSKRIVVVPPTDERNGTALRSSGAITPILPRLLNLPESPASQSDKVDKGANENLPENLVSQQDDSLTWDSYTPKSGERWIVECGDFVVQTTPDSMTSFVARNQESTPKSGILKRARPVDEASNEVSRVLQSRPFENIKSSVEPMSVFRFASPPLVEEGEDVFVDDGSSSCISEEIIFSSYQGNNECRPINNESRERIECLSPDPIIEIAARVLRDNSHEDQTSEPESDESCYRERRLCRSSILASTSRDTEDGARTTDAVLLPYDSLSLKEAPSFDEESNGPGHIPAHLGGPKSEMDLEVGTEGLTGENLLRRSNYKAVEEDTESEDSEVKAACFIGGIWCRCCAAFACLVLLGLLACLILVLLSRDDARNGTDPSRLIGSTTPSPTWVPRVDAPTAATIAMDPTTSPSMQLPTFAPSTGSPTMTMLPTQLPTAPPTHIPTTEPSSMPTWHPTGLPTGFPSHLPTLNPTAGPTKMPSREPTSLPTNSPIGVPSASPTGIPSSSPTKLPSLEPTKSPTRTPSVPPTNLPSSSPSMPPTFVNIQLDDGPWTGILLEGDFRWAVQGNQLRLPVLSAVGDPWKPLVAQSVQDWNAANTVSLTLQQGNVGDCTAISGAIKICSQDFGQTSWYGLALLFLDGANIASVTIRLNDAKRSDWWAWNQYNVCHQLGHALGLRHSDEIGNCMGPSIGQSPLDLTEPGMENIQQLQDIYNPSRAAGAGPPPKADMASFRDLGNGLRVIRIALEGEYE